MKKKYLLILMIGIFAVFWAMGAGEVAEAAVICSNCQNSNHSSCSNPTYKNNGSSGHTQTCCCTTKFSINVAGHSKTTYVNTASTCWKCVCGYTESHNSSGSKCSKAHCPYYTKARCSRGCNHALWVNCVGHTYGSTWKNDATKHWKQCTYGSCTATSSEANHEDTNNDGKCDTCGYQMKINVAKPKATTTSFIYTGSVQSIVLSGFNSSTMTLSGGSNTNAGSYTATVSLNNTTTHQWSDGTTANVTFSWTINRASILVPSGKNHTYDGSSKTGVSSGIGYSLGGKLTATDAGTYIATATLDANHQWSDNTTATKNISWTIETKKVATVWGSKTTFTYNGKEQGPEVTANSGIPGETLNLTGTMQINAGTYTSVATIASVTGGREKVSNYTLTNNAIGYVINKAECKIVLTKTHLDLLKNQTKTVGYTYNGDGTLSVSATNAAIANATINTTNKLVSVTGVAEGSTTVTVSAAAGTNYLATNASLTVTVHPSPTIESVKINNGANTTKNVEVVMEIKATSVSKMYISNTNETPDVNAEGWVDYKLYSKHKLTWQNGAKIVYVWGKDEFDNITVASTAGITLDVRYSLSLKNNQKYLGRLESSSKYAIKADDGGWQWQDSNVFINLISVTVYTLKTQLYDIVGITGESEELKLRAVYDNDGKLYIEYIN